MTPRAYASPKRDAAAQRTRQRLVRAAARLMKSREGLRALSLDSVARAAGVSRLTVYNQFGSRRGLLEALFDDRASRGGMHRLQEAMANPDPSRGLERLIEVFCDFWDYDRRTMSGLVSAAGSDPELSAGILARNERRRKALAVLVHRIDALRHVPSRTVADLIDVLFVLTSFAVFAELARGGRDAASITRLIKELAFAALERAMRPDAGPITPD
jgi:AcrR family transcriptional regulator